VSEVHDQVQLTLPSQMARALCDSISTELLAYILDQDEDTVEHWARGDAIDSKQESKRRLIAAYEILQLIDRFEEPGVAQTWLIGSEPQLDFIMPAKALREGRLEETLAVARHFVAVG
jgi:hypothetical protein